MMVEVDVDVDGADDDVEAFPSIFDIMLPSLNFNFPVPITAKLSAINNRVIGLRSSSYESSSFNEESETA